MGSEFVQLSLTPLVIAIMAAVACALPGNFLLLRRQALVGDALSHVVLPGIVVAFIITGSITTGPMMFGAIGASILAVILIEVVKRVGRIEPGAAMGVVFPTLFAAGVLLLEQSDTSGVHLDVEHALYGNLESLIWLAADGWGSLFDVEALADLPPELLRMTATATVIALLTVIFWRPLKLSTFDEGFARTVGIPVVLVSFGLVMASAVAVVSAFDAVGSIIVIAMLVCPPASARLMTNRLELQILWSIVFAASSAVLGYVLGGYGPLWLGSDYSVSAAGTIATVSGVILALTAFFGPCRSRTGEPVRS